MELHSGPAFETYRRDGSSGGSQRIFLWVNRRGLSRSHNQLVSMPPAMVFMHGICHMLFQVLHLIPSHSGTGYGKDRDITAQWRVWTGHTAVDCDTIYGSFVTWSRVGALGGVVLGR